MTRTRLTIITQAAAVSLVMVMSNMTFAQGQASDWLGRVTFLASFDNGLEADVSSSDRRVHTAEDLDRKQSVPGNQIESVSIAKDQGRFGHAIRFADKTQQSLFYSGQTVGYRKENWSGTVSVWMKLDPNIDLEPGYCDPIVLTDQQWDRAALFVDFDKDLPRDFRLGVFPDFDVWNPDATPWDKIAIADRPMIVVKEPPFATDQWTHVCFTWEDANLPNNQPGRATLYLNGQNRGSHSQVMRYTWQPERVAIAIGIYYIGLMDELAVFDAALSAEQIKELYQLPGGLAEKLTKNR